MKIATLVEKIKSTDFAHKDELVQLLTVLVGDKLDMDVRLFCNETDQQNERLQLDSKINLIYEMVCTDRWDDGTILSTVRRPAVADCLSYYSIENDLISITADYWDESWTGTIERTTEVPAAWLNLNREELLVAVATKFKIDAKAQDIKRAKDRITNIEARQRAVKRDEANLAAELEEMIGKLKLLQSGE